MGQTKSFVKQASILAVAGIVVRIIGVLYRSPLTELITPEGIGYYGTAYNIYALILLISSYSIPSAISKLIAEKLTLHQYNNAQKILKCAYIYICVIGGATALVTYILAPFIVTEHAVPALRVLTPTIFLSGLLGVLRGYFQAYQTTVYTSVSQIIEQVFNAIVSILAAYLFIQPYLMVGGSDLASAGATGSAIGTGAGVTIGLCYMFFMYMRKRHKLIVQDEPDLSEDSYKTIFRMIIQIVTPIIFATCVYNLVTTLDMYIFYFFMNIQGISTVEAVTMYGIYSGEFIVLQNVPVALASAMSTAAIPSIASSWALRNKNMTRSQIASSIRVTMIILIPSAIGLAILAFPIIGLLFPQEETLYIATNLLILGSPAIVFFGLSTLTNGILQAIGEVNVPLKNAIVALGYHIVLLVILLMLTPLDLFALVIANTTYGFHICYLNSKALKRYTHYKDELRRTYFLPLLAAVIMGVVTYITYYGLFALTSRVLFPMLISFILSVTVYFVVVIFLYSDHLEELEQIPYLTKIARKILKK